jgi:hypothetical protein
MHLVTVALLLAQTLGAEPAKKSKAPPPEETYQSPTGTTYSVPGGMKKYQPKVPAKKDPDAAVDVERVVLLTAQDEMAERIPVKVLADYIKRAEAEAHLVFDKAERGTPTSVVAELTFEPKKKPQLKLAMKSTVPVPLMDALRERLSQLEAPAVIGPVKFELYFSLWGGTSAGP